MPLPAALGGVIGQQGLAQVPGVSPTRPATQVFQAPLQAGQFVPALTPGLAQRLELGSGQAPSAPGLAELFEVLPAAGQRLVDPGQPAAQPVGGQSSLQGVLTKHGDQVQFGHLGFTSEDDPGFRSREGSGKKPPACCREVSAM